jgi:FkbM family methyltransferase
MAGTCASIAQSVRQAGRCRVRAHGEVWVHSFSDGVVVAPAPGTRSPAYWEAAARDWYLHFHTPSAGDVIFDVGAGIGSEAPVFSNLVGPTGRVVCIEANPRIYGCLTECVRRNSLDNVVTRNCAVVEQTGTVHIEDCVREHLGNSVSAGGVGVPVPGETLADVMAATGVERIDFLKVNIEGSELPMLRACASLFDRITRMSVHCHDFVADREGDERFRTFDGVADLLSDAGYVLRLRRDHALPWIRDSIYAVRGEVAGEDR